MVLDIAYFILFFILAYLFLHFLYPSKINYIENYKKVVGGFVIGFLVVCLFYYKFYVRFILGISSFQLIILILFFIFLFTVYALLRKRVNKGKILIFEKQHVYYASFDKKFIYSMSANLLCQQFGIAILLGILMDVGLSKLMVIFTFACISLFSHLYYSLRNRRIIDFIFTVAATIAAIVWSYLLLSFSGAIIYTYILHWSFYLLSGIFLQFRRSINFNKLF